ncbi:MAG: TrmB family transcriptional regulator [Fimbriimonas sp.]
MLNNDAIQAMGHLGFTALEAQIYAFLLGESPATGYRIAQAIGKPAANTYKALQTLEQKGAVVLDAEDSKQCSPVPLDELMGRLAREFAARRTLAETALRQVEPRAKEDRMVILKSPEAVFAKATSLLDSAESVVLGIWVGLPSKHLLDCIDGAVARGVQVSLVTSELALPNQMDVAAWDGAGRAQLILVADIQEVLQASFSPDGSLRNGFSISSHPLAELQHQAIAARHCLQNLAVRIEEGAGTKRLTRVLHSERSLEAGKPSDIPAET